MRSVCTTERSYVVEKEDGDELRTRVEDIDVVVDARVITACNDKEARSDERGGVPRASGRARASDVGLGPR